MEQHASPKRMDKPFMSHSKNPRRPLSDRMDCLWLRIENIAIKVFLLSPLSSSQPYLFIKNVICPFFWIFIFNTTLQIKYLMANKLISCPIEGTINYTQYSIPEALLSPTSDADADRNITPFTKILYSRGNIVGNVASSAQSLDNTSTEMDLTIDQNKSSLVFLFWYLILLSILFLPYSFLLFPFVCVGIGLRVFVRMM